MFTLLCLLGSEAARAEDVPERAERLAALRSEVETLQHEVSMDKADARARLTALESARTEVELQIRQEELQLQQLRVQIDRERTAAEGEGAAHEVLIPSIRAGIAALRPVIEAGIPYRVPERTAALDEIETQLDAGTWPPHKAANRLWSLFEDELRLGRENAVDRQTIALDGAEVLVDVARLGMVALYFRASDGRVGFAERQGAGWTWRTAGDRASQQRIGALFDALEKQIRVGWFEIPNALPEVQR